MPNHSTGSKIQFARVLTVVTISRQPPDDRHCSRQSISEVLKRGENVPLESTKRGGVICRAFILSYNFIDKRKKL